MASGVGMKNYFDTIEDSQKKTFEGMVFTQLCFTLWAGSQDTSTKGKVAIQDDSGKIYEIVKTNFESVFINSVWSLYQLVRDKLPPDIRKNYIRTRDDYIQARKNFMLILEYLHKSGIFGRQKLMVVWDPETQKSRLKVKELEERLKKLKDKIDDADKDKQPGN